MVKEFPFASWIYKQTIYLVLYLFFLNVEVCKPNTIKQWWSRTSKVSNLFKTEIIFIGIAGFVGKSFSRGINWFQQKGYSPEN